MSTDVPVREPSADQLPACGTARAGGSDLDDRSAIHDLVVAFYREIVFDDVLAPVFQDAETDWALHIPRLIDYWCRILLGAPGYDGALLVAHREVHQRDPFRTEHFERWYRLWAASVDARWRGPRAERAKTHAASTARLISRRLRGTDLDLRITDPVEPGADR